jgi:hypothetical protein
LVEAPPVETAPVETPPVEKLPVETPPVDPPVETSPVGPPVEAPAVETPLVEKISTTTMLVSSANPSMVEQAVTYTATINALAATGTVEFKDGGVVVPECADQAVSFSSATCTVAGYPPAGEHTIGEHTITATYSGDSNYLTSTSSPLTQTTSGQSEDKVAGKTATTTSLSSSLNPSRVGEAVTYTATLDTTAATGTVEFKQAGIVIVGCSAQPVSAGRAQCTVVSSSLGWRLVTAVYSGDGSYAASISSPGVGQEVYRKNTTIALSSSSNPSRVGEAVAYTATISPAAATGTIEFKQAGVVIVGCAAQPVSAGRAQCTVVDSSSGWRLVTAGYSGDSEYIASTSPGVGQEVNRKPTTLTLASSLNPSRVGEAVTYTATLNPTAATGSVEFKQAGVLIADCAAQPVSAGKAQCTAVSSSVGWRLVTAVYSGDGSYAASISSPGVGQEVYRKTTTITLSSSLNPSRVGQSVTYLATMSPATATGTVAFDEAGTPIVGCAAQPVSSGTARCTTTGYPSWSSYAVTAAYSGDSSCLPSVSPTFTQIVEPPNDTTSPFRFFSPTSFWNKELSANTPLDPSSAGIVGALNEVIAGERQAGNGPGINTIDFSVPVYTVPADQPTVMVTLANASIEGSWGASALQSAWDAVPLPSDAQPAAGTDKHLVVWQPSTDRLWEFLQMEHGEDGWHAFWGGAIQNVSTDSGAYSSEAWPGSEPRWGASASSLSIAGGLITLEDLELGQINHALAMAIPDPRAGVYASPAQRTDGKSTNPLSLPEGAHLRLDPSLDLASLHLSRMTLMIAEAAQRYGIVVRDTASHVTLYAQDPTPTGANPYLGPHGYFEGKSPQQLLESFPWSHLQLLKMELHSNP